MRKITAMDSSSSPSGAVVPPDRAALRAAALAHLARFGTTRHGLGRVLLRRIARWQHLAEAAGADAQEAAQTARALGAVVEEIVQEMAGLGAVDDHAFARSRAGRLMRSGRSVQAVQAHLAARGVDASVRAAVVDAQEEGGGLDRAERDLCAALVLARRRKLGPFAVSGEASTEADPTQAARALGVLARAGFGRDTAQRALEMDGDEAWQWLERMKAES